MLHQYRVIYCCTVGHLNKFFHQIILVKDYCFISNFVEYYHYLLLWGTLWQCTCIITHMFLDAPQPPMQKPLFSRFVKCNNFYSQPPPPPPPPSKGLSFVSSPSLPHLSDPYWLKKDKLDDEGLSIVTPPPPAASSPLHLFPPPPPPPSSLPNLK